MKKLALVVSLALMTQVAVSQSVFDKFENVKDVTSLVVTKQMFKLMSSVDLSSSDPEAQAYLRLVENLDNIKVFTTENTSVAADMRAEVEKYLKSSSGLEELMRVKDDGTDIKFYSKPGKDENHISELLMFLNAPGSGKAETVLLSITGNIDLKQLSKLTTDLKIPGGDKLKDIDKQ